MAAAPVSVVGEWSLASPELALVDADLAAALRHSLPSTDEAWKTSALERTEPIPALIDTAVQSDVDGPRDADRRGGEAGQPHDAEYGSATVEPPSVVSQQSHSHDPVLPTLDLEVHADETDAALAQIRERLRDELPPGKPRKLRRRFTFASGATAIYALGTLAINVQFHVAQLPGFLR